MKRYLFFCFFYLIWTLSFAQSLPFQTIGTLAHPSLKECSGIDTYLDHYFLALNDSGGEPEIFVCDLEGKDWGVFQIEGVHNRDWEDLTVVGEHLYIGEIGDNQRVYPHIKIHQVVLPPQPPGAGKRLKLKVRSTAQVHYPDGPHDCEALFWRKGELHLLTKNRGDGHQCFALVEKNQKLFLEKRGEFKLSSHFQITGADYENNTLVLSTYWGWMLFPEPLFDITASGVLHTQTKQLESICFWKDQILWTGEYREVFLHPVVEGVHYYLPPREQRIVPFVGKDPFNSATFAPLIGDAAFIGWNEEGFYFSLVLPLHSEEETEGSEPLISRVVFGWDAFNSYELFRTNQEVFLIQASEEKTQVAQLEKQQWVPQEKIKALTRVEGKTLWCQVFLPVKEKLVAKSIGSGFMAFDQPSDSYFGTSWAHYPWDRPYQWGEFILLDGIPLQKEKGEVLSKEQASALTSLQTDPTRLDAKIPADPQILRKHIQFLTELQPPRTFKNTDSLNKAADYISAFFKESGLSVERQKYQIQDQAYFNIIGSYGPKDAPRLILGAHYDVCQDQPGADDNASGVAGLLELARLLAKLQPSLLYRIDLVAYTLEEPPFFRTELMGSAIHAKSLMQQKVNVKAMFSLEMIGYFSEEPHSQKYPIEALSFVYPHTGNFIALVSNPEGMALILAFKEKMKRVSSLDVQTLAADPDLAGIDFSDHLNYWKYQFQAGMITDTSFYRNPHYHQKTDTIDTLNFEKMTEVVRGVYEGMTHFED